MSSSKNQFPQPPRSASSPLSQPETQAAKPESVPLAETNMDQPTASTLTMDSSAASTPLEPENDSGQSAVTRQHPIPPASEPMQYRAIGLVKGRYNASSEQFTRGMLIAEDGTAIDAVLLGRVMSLVKKHLDLEQSHLWVVYPRTREKDNDLHVQIVGVWEPEKLNKAVELNSSEADSPEADNPEADSPEADRDAHTPSMNLEDGYFSVRGEVLFQSPEEERLIVKIQQSPRRGSEEGKVFKLMLKGTVTGKAVGYFWDFKIQREGNLLVVLEGKMVALVPPKKRKAGERRSGPGPAKKRWDGPREGQRQARPGSDRPGVATPPTRREPIAKPVKRPKNQST